MTQDEHPLVTKYREFSPASEALHEKARKVFPGGDTRSSAHYGPYPLTITEASGCVMKDADGHEVLDFMNNFTSLVHGHARPPARPPGGDPWKGVLFRLLGNFSSLAYLD